jgi:hypothetical protein
MILKLKNKNTLGPSTYTTIKNGTSGQTGNDIATIATTWGTKDPAGNNTSTGGSVTVFEPD